VVGGGDILLHRTLCVRAVRHVSHGPSVHTDGYIRAVPRPITR
jgi:hypothetical protein